MPVWLTEKIADLLPWQAFVIAETIGCLALAICGAWIALRRNHAGSRIFMAGCGLLAAKALYEMTGIVFWFLEIDAETLLTSPLALELWQALNSMTFSFELAGIGLLIWGTWRSFRFPDADENHAHSG